MKTAFYTTERLGKRQSRTPEGFLLCEQVPLARTGTMLYSASDFGGSPPVEPGADGQIRIERDADVVFDPESVASYQGKPFTIGHPDGEITEKNWRELAHGTVHNPRRGEGIEDDILFGDVLITSADAIEAVLGGMREVSCGYDADYEQITPGRGRQTKIIGNHVALVTQGRCGPRCSIGDGTMATKRTWRERIKDAFVSKDEAALDAALKGITIDEMTGGEGAATGTAGEGTHHHVTLNLHQPSAAETGDDEEKGDGGEVLKQVMARLDAIEQALAVLASAEEDEDEVEEGEGETGDALAKTGEEDPQPGATGDDLGKTGEEDPAPGATGDKKAKTGDSAGLETSFQLAMSRAEILTPGVKLLTFDAASGSAKTIDALCSFRRSVLQKAHAENDDAKDAIGVLVDGADFAKSLPKMTCDAVLTLFNGTASIVKEANNRRVVGSGYITDHGSKVKTPTLAEINQRNRKENGQPAR